MLLFDKRQIGNRLFALRKNTGMTQLELAAAAGLSERTYADIERGETNMRVGTLLQICKTLRITPDEILTDTEEEPVPTREELLERLDACAPKERETAIKLLMVYLQSLRY